MALFIAALALNFNSLGAFFLAALRNGEIQLTG